MREPWDGATQETPIESDDEDDSDKNQQGEGWNGERGDRARYEGRCGKRLELEARRSPIVAYQLVGIEPVEAHTPEAAPELASNVIPPHRRMHVLDWNRVDEPYLSPSRQMRYESSTSSL